jgi:hypothetical protein
MATQQQSATNPQPGHIYRHSFTGQGPSTLIVVESLLPNVVLWSSYDGKRINGETRGSMPLNRFESECQYERPANASSSQDASRRAA